MLIIMQIIEFMKPEKFGFLFKRQVWRRHRLVHVDEPFVVMGLEDPNLSLAPSSVEQSSSLD